MVLRHPIRRSILLAALVHALLRKKTRHQCITTCFRDFSRSRALARPPFADAKHQPWGTYDDAHRGLARATRAAHARPCFRARFSASRRPSRRRDRARRAREGCGSGSRTRGDGRASRAVRDDGRGWRRARASVDARGRRVLIARARVRGDLSVARARGWARVRRSVACGF